MIIIGMDLSFTGTGLIKYKDGQVIGQKLIKTETEGKDIQDRFKRINIALNDIKNFCFSEGVAKSDEDKIIIIEGYSFNSRSGMCFSIGEMGGVIKNDLYQRFLNGLCGIKAFHEIPPNQLKKFITGSGQCKKELILKEVYKAFGFDTDNNNIADAFALAYLGYAIYCNENNIAIKLNVAQKSIVDFIIQKNIKHDEEKQKRKGKK